MIIKTDLDIENYRPNSSGGMMKFTPEFIAKQRELAKAIGIEPGSIFRKNDTELGAISGYDSETGSSYSGAFAVFLTKQDATYAHEALSNYPAALDEIERQREALEKYANRSNWWSHGDNGFPEQTVYEWQGEGDGTDVARKALKGGEE